MKLSNVKSYVILAVIAVMSIVMQLPLTSTRDSLLLSQVNLQIPNVTSNAAYSALSVRWTAGTLNNGGTAVAVTASSIGLTALQNSCTAPTFNACNILWSNSSGAVSVTATSTGFATAAATGNSIMAFISTSATAITRIVYPQQTSIAMVPGWMMLDCGTSASCATPVSMSAAIRSFGGSLTVATTSAVTVTGLLPAFTSTATYGCTAMVDGATANTRVTGYTRVSASSITLFLTGVAGSETISWRCNGY